MRHAHRPTGSLDLWEFMEMVIRLSALRFPEETCLDSLVEESIQPHLAKDARDEVRGPLPCVLITIFCVFDARGSVTSIHDVAGKQLMNWPEAL